RRLVTPGFRLGRRSRVSFYKRAKGMSQQEQRHREVLGVEALEGRALLSGLGVERPHASPAAEVGRAGHPMLSAVNSAALQAILAAMGGGPGHEFITLIQREVKNPLGVVEGFSSGAISQYIIRGLVVKKTNWQSQYTGFPHDPLSLSAGGAVVL